MSSTDEQRGAPDEQHRPADERAQASGPSSAGPHPADPQAGQAHAAAPTPEPAAAAPASSPSPYAPGGYPPPPGSAQGVAPGYGYPGQAGPAYPQPGAPAQGHPGQPYAQDPYAGHAHPQQPYPQQPYPTQPYAQPYPQAPYAQPGAGYAPPADTPGAAAGAARTTYAGEGHTAGAPTSPRPSAFHGVPVRDYVTDVVALVLLLVSLGLGWDFRYAASERVEVVLVTVASVLSLSLFYLARSGALPRGWTNRTVLTARALANAPFALVALVYLVLDATVAFGDGPAWGKVPGGVGPAVAIGLAGAVLAASPRAAELRAAPTAELATRWTRRALVGLLGAVLVLQLVGLLAMVLNYSRYLRSSAVGAGIAAVAVLVLLVTAIAAAPLLGVLRGSGPWRRVLITVAGTAAATFVLYAPLNHEQADAGIHSATSMALWNVGYVLVPTAGVLVMTPVWRRLVRPDATVERGWFDAASLAWISIAVVAGAMVLAHVIILVADATQGGDVDGWRVQLALAVAACGAAALIARALFDATAPTRATALALTLATVVLGIVALAIGADRTPLGSDGSLSLLLVALGLPTLVGVALLGPAPVRAWFVAHGGGPRPAWDDSEPGFRGAHPAGLQPNGPQASGPYAGAAPVAATPVPAAPVTGADPSSHATEAHAGVDERTHPRVAAEASAPAAPETAPAGDEHGDEPAHDEGRTWFDEYSSVDSAPVPEQAPELVPTAADPDLRDDHTVAITLPDELASGEVPTGDAPPVPHGGDAPAHPYTAEQALDPSTELEVLAAIAAQAPELRVHLASNPSTYPDLLEWLGRLGDPEIDAALARRRG